METTRVSEKLASKTHAIPREGQTCVGSQALEKLASKSHPLPEALGSQALEKFFSNIRLIPGASTDDLRGFPTDDLMGFLTYNLRINEHPPDRDMAEKFAQYAMCQINAHSWDKYKKKYRLVEIEAARTTFTDVYISFMAKEDEEGGVVEKFVARLSYPPPEAEGIAYFKRRLKGYCRLLADGTWETLLDTPPLYKPTQGF